MKVCVAAPIATADLLSRLSPAEVAAMGSALPRGYEGAPLTAVLVGELLDQGHQVQALTVDYKMAPGSARAVLHGPGLTYHVLPGRRRAWRPNGWQLGRALDLYRLERRMITAELRALAPDLVHAHWTYEFALAALDSGLPTVVTAHDAPAEVVRITRSAYRALRYLMARRVLRRARHVTTVSDYLARALAPAIGHPVDVVPNPVARHVMEAGRWRASPPARPRLGLVCNGWSAIKNPEVALRAFALFRAQQGGELHCFGEDFGPEQVAQRWARAAGLDEGVVFHGRQDHAAMIQALADLDGLLHTALEESFGVVIAEAMALGLPVVAGQRTGAVPWVLGMDPSSPSTIGPGVLTEVTRAEAVAAALAVLFDDRYGERSALGLAQARARFSPDVVAERYLQVYRAALADPAASDWAAPGGVHGHA